jgi:hypothetical protein
MTDYSGSCHCGAIGFTYSTQIAPPDWSIRSCQCSFCLVHDAQSTSDPAGKLRFSAVDPGKMQRYQFGLRTADFLLCRECGVYIGAIIETGKGMWGIINTHALSDPPTDISVQTPIDYDGEISGDRVSRREERWTPATLK